MYYLHVVIVLLSMSLYKSAFSTYYFGNVFLCFGFMFLYLCFLAFIFFYCFLCFEFNVVLNNARINNITQFSSHFMQMIC